MRMHIGQIAIVQLGFQLRTNAKRATEGTNRLLQMSDVDSSGHVNARTLTPLNGGASSDRYQVGDGDVVFQARGSRNLAFVLRGVPANTLASSQFYILRMRSDVVLPEYLAWFVNQPAAQVLLSGKAQGTTTMLVSKEAFESLEIDVPPIHIQEKILTLHGLLVKEKQLCELLLAKRVRVCEAVSRRAAQVDNRQDS